MQLPQACWATVHSGTVTVLVQSCAQPRVATERARPPWTSGLARGLALPILRLLLKPFKVQPVAAVRVRVKGEGEGEGEEREVRERSEK